MTARNPLVRLAAILAAILLPLSLLIMAAGPASAAPARPAITAGAIFGPCNGLQDGQVRYFGRNRYVCTYVWGLGYYWVEANNACTPSAVARETSAC